MNSKLIKIAAFIFFIIPMVCQAEIIKFGFTGRVDTVYDTYNLLENKVNPNDLITGFYIFDSTKSDSNPSIYLGRYQYITAPNGMFLSAGDISFQTDSSNVNFSINLSNNYDGEAWDYYSVISNNNLPLANGLIIDSISLFFEDFPGTAISSDALLLTPQNLSTWRRGKRLSISGGQYLFPLPPCPETIFTISGHIYSVYLVPEPATIMLLGLGAIFIRRRK